MTDLTPTAAAAPSAAARPSRVLYLDNLRVVLTVLVVLHHVAITYGNVPLWYYHEPAQDPSGTLLDMFVVINQMFFMGAFFLISGYFTPASYDRNGARGFLRSRLVRLVVPLLAYLLLLRPLVNFGGFAAMREAFAQDGATLSYWQYYLLSWDPGPMWFVEVLLVFALGYALLRRLRGPAAGAPAPLRPRPPRWPTVAGFVAVLAAVTYAWRLLVPSGAYWPIVGLPTPSYLPQYLMLFAVGAMAYRRGWLTALPRAAGRVGAVAAGRVGAVAAGVALLVLVVASAGSPSGTPDPLVHAVFEAVFATGIIVGLVVWFRERFDRQGGTGRFLSRQAYAVYVVHPLVLVALGYAFAGLGMIAVAKFALVAAVAVPACWLLASAVRALPGARRVL